MTQVAIIDYGVGNLRSVEKAFAATGCDAIVTGNDRELRNAERLVLPGVGAFGACMQALTERGFDHLVRERVREGIPLLGVCVGMQMLFEESDEFGRTAGLGLLRGCVQRFSNDLVVPQVGWNQIRQRKMHTLFEGVTDQSFFYFVHSFFCVPVDNSTTSPMGEMPAPAVAGLKFRREPKSVYVQSSVQSAAFVNVIVTDTGIVGRVGS